MDAPTREVKALVQLLDDPDPDVQDSVRSRLDELGRAALPTLRDVRDRVDSSLRDEIDHVVQTLHFRDVRTAWNAVLSQEAVSLERGAFLLALYRFPQLDIEAYQEQLDDLAEEARPAVEAATGAARARQLAEVMTEQFGFSGNREHYYDPNNSYLNQVLDRRLGIPISLSTVYLLLARRLDLPACGANVPVHFLVKYAGPGGELFLDPFNNGDVVPKEDIVRFLLKAGIRPVPMYFQCAETTDILLRMARNLLAIAEDTNQTQTARDLRRLIAPHDPDLEIDDDEDSH